jgi:hypothetical protein
VIVASLLLILGAVVLLVLGLVNGSSALLIGSIAVSLLAAVALVVGARQAAAARAEDEFLEAEPEREFDGDEVAEPVFAGARAERAAGREAADPYARAGEPTVALAEPVTRTVPAQSGYAAGPRHGPDPVGSELGPQWAEPAAPPDDADEYDDEDPPDEPVPQSVSPADAARVARLSTEVLVIDGRPRYHLPGCVHLLGRESEPLPVSEAVELGFTPCSLCEPDNALLADARRS